MLYLFSDMSAKEKVDRTVLFARKLSLWFFCSKFSIDSLECEFFIDYISSQNGSDRSLRLGNELQKKYGAKVVEQPNPSTTTHIVFKNGD